MTTFQYLIGPHLWIKRSPEWNAVMEAVALPLFRDHERSQIMQWIDLESRTINWDAIHQAARQFGPESRIVLRIAHALFNGGDCQLAEIGELSSAGRSAVILLIGQRYR